MRIPIGQAFEFSVRVLEESGYDAEDMRNLSNAVFGVYDLATDAEVFKVSTTAPTAEGSITADLSGTTTVTTAIVVTDTITEEVLSSSSTDVKTPTIDAVAGLTETVNSVDDAGAGTTTTTTVTTEIEEVNKGIIRISLLVPATELLAEQRRGTEDRFTSKQAYRGVIVINIDDRASIAVEIPTIDALRTPAL